MKVKLVIVLWSSQFAGNSTELIKEAFLLSFWASNVTRVSRMEIDLGNGLNVENS